MDKCKGCGKEHYCLVTTGSQRNADDNVTEWHDLYLCRDCWVKYRKEHGIKSLRDIDNELRKKDLNNKKVKGR